MDHERDVYLVTGCAGFIGFYISNKLLEEGKIVIGVDNLNDYYDVNLKLSRLQILNGFSSFEFHKMDISNQKHVLEIFKKYNPTYVLHLAAQAGVRFSIENPDVYIQSNLIGFYNILESCRKYPVKHLIYASSSSVYGANEKVPFEESDHVDKPVSLYAATKKSNELLAYSYSHLYGIYTTGLRFFTVYGPMGRPDMACYKFTNLYFENSNIEIYNNEDFDNDMYRDFTYIDDVIEGIFNLMDTYENREKKYQIYNIGNNNPVSLMKFITTLEGCLSLSLGEKIEFKKVYKPIQPGDVLRTYASTDKLYMDIGYMPKTTIKDGLQMFSDWYVKYHKLLRK